jgi:GTPase SAR1 family protein
VVVVFDLTSYKTFSSLREYIQKVKAVRNMPIVIVGTKADLCSGQDVRDSREPDSDLNDTHSTIRSENDVSNSTNSLF